MFDTAVSIEDVKDLFDVFAHQATVDVENAVQKYGMSDTFRIMSTIADIDECLGELEADISEIEQRFEDSQPIKKDSIHGKRVTGGIAVGPYTFADGLEGYIVVAPHSQRYDTHNIPWCSMDGNIDGLMYSPNKNWIDPNTGVANTHQLTVAKRNNRTFLAADYCSNLVFEGCDDFFLPNKNELEYICGYTDTINSVDETGSLGTGYYWSSSEFHIYAAWTARFSIGAAFDTKYSPRAVVPIRRILI